jgi:hypothetical protein
MGRPERRDCDYFPFICKDGRTLFILEQKYDCKGTGFFTNVMRFLTLQPDHHFCVQDESDRLYFFSKCRCDVDSGMDMLNIMAKTCKIHRFLWVSYGAITSPDLLKSLNDAYRTRKNPIITIDEIISIYAEDVPDNFTDSDDNDVSCAENDVSCAENAAGIENGVVSCVDKPQTKLKETKVNKQHPSGGFFKNTNHIYFKSIETSTIKLLKLPISVKSKPFNPYEFTNWAINTENYHPGAVDYALQALVKKAKGNGSKDGDDIKDLFAYGRTVLKTANGNFCERDHIKDYEALKQDFNDFINNSKQIQDLLKQVF